MVVASNGAVPLAFGKKSQAAPSLVGVSSQPVVVYRYAIIQIRAVQAPIGSPVTQSRIRFHYKMPCWKPYPSLVKSPMDGSVGNWLLSYNFSWRIFGYNDGQSGGMQCRINGEPPDLGRLQIVFSFISVTPDGARFESRWNTGCVSAGNICWVP